MIGSAIPEQAATLAKADLTTGMVGEFPELQGVMGRYYAAHDGDAAAVAAARQRWKLARSLGLPVTYWKQGERGWEKQG